MTEERLTAAQVATILGISKPAVLKAATAGVLAGERVPATGQPRLVWLFRAADVAAYAAAPPRPRGRRQRREA